MTILGVFTITVVYLELEHVHLRSMQQSKEFQLVSVHPILTEVFGCSDYPDSPCNGSDSRCFESLEQYQRLQECGGSFERACTLGERPTINRATGQACSSSELKQGGIGKGCPGGCRGSSTRCYPVKTFLTCYTKTSDRTVSAETSWEWGLKPNSTEYYTLEGYWYGGFPGSNMFYTKLSQDSLLKICADTLSRKKLPPPTAFFAADTTYDPFNYTIWTNDSSVATPEIDKIIAFGDSLSDTGNLLNRSVGLVPNKQSWFLGRFSNNHVWVEYLADLVKLPLYNWAFGAAHAEDVGGYKIIAPKLKEQIASWKAYMKKAKHYRIKNTLFVVFIGANDIKDTPNTVDVLAAEVEAGLKELIVAGARQLLVLNVPDISQAPEVRDGDPKVAKIVKADVDEYNVRLTKMVKRLSTNKARIVLFDIHTLFNDMLSDPAKYGMHVTDRSCLRGLNQFVTNYALPHQPRTECNADDAKGWVFWDEVHPTTAIHKKLADGAYQAVQPLLVPPSGISD